jgi:1,2-phenylacetyl-CoA epoxidase catalytic subunit
METTTISTTEERRGLLRQILALGDAFEFTLRKFDSQWNPPEPGELADSLGALRRQLDETMGHARARLKAETELQRVEAELESGPCPA